VDEKEINEYKELSDKVDSKEITFNELLKLNEFHVRFLRTGYHKVVKSQETQQELEETVELVSAALDQMEAINTILSMFIEEQGLSDEFKEYLDEAIYEFVKEGTHPDLIN
jgi:hypothetical protein